ncbi:hypothetical protein D3C86_2245160 [compost metagenome]
MADIVVLGPQGLRSEVQFGVHLYRLGRGLFMGKNAQVGVKSQTGQVQGLAAHSS